jgi:hypothetical protein
MMRILVPTLKNLAYLPCLATFQAFKFVAYFIWLEITYCTNTLARNCQFLVGTATPDAHKGMDLLEVGQLVRLNNHNGKYLTAQQVVDLLWVKDKVPLYINMEVHESRPNLTLVYLLCSRRLRSEEHLYHQIDTYPPFHILVPLPPGYQKGAKFDINFQKQGRRLDKLRYLFRK